MKHENNLSPSSAGGRRHACLPVGRGEGGTSWVSLSPQSSPPVGGEEVFGVIFYLIARQECIENSLSGCGRRYQFFRLVVISSTLIIFPESA